MARPSKRTADQKLQVVLSVLRGEATAAEAGRKAGVSEQSVHNWKRIFLESGRVGLGVCVVAGQAAFASSLMSPSRWLVRIGELVAIGGRSTGRVGGRWPSERCGLCWLWWVM